LRGEFARLSAVSILVKSRPTALTSGIVAVQCNDQFEVLRVGVAVEAADTAGALGRKADLWGNVCG
jgi:hypothetical protein